MKFKKIMAWLAASAMAVSTMAIAAAAEEGADNTEDGGSDNGYIAAITFQTSSYKFRNTLGQADCLAWDDEVGAAVKIDGSSTVDAEITGNGTYVVELEGIEDSGWNMLKIDTNISSDDFPDIDIIVKAIVLDGVSVSFNAEDVTVDVSQNMNSDDYSDFEFSALRAARVQLINTYDGITAVENKGYTSVKVLFEVAGMGYDAEGLPEISVDDLTFDAADNSGDNSGDSDNSGDNSGDSDNSGDNAGDSEGTTTTAAPTSSSSSCTCGGSNASIVIGVLAVAAAAILIFKKVM